MRNYLNTLNLPSASFFPLFAMENLQVMGFIDVFRALPKLFFQFQKIRKAILKLSPKAILCIDYPGFNLAMQKSLRQKGYRGKIIHFVCPTVWAWKKHRIQQMEKNVDLLLALFPFEPAYFSHTQLPVHYVGHPLALPIASFVPKGTFKNQKVLAIFPGSRKTEIGRNLPLQLLAARKLKSLDPSLTIALSIATPEIESLLRPLAPEALFVPPEENYELMRGCHLAIATSGTVTLELALHGTPTVVNFALPYLDRFIAQKIFRIDLPHYCIVNLIASKRVFPELIGPQLTEEQLFFWAQKLWFDGEARKQCLQGCEEVRKSLGTSHAAQESARWICRTVDF